MVLMSFPFVVDSVCLNLSRVLTFLSWCHLKTNVYLYCQNKLSQSETKAKQVNELVT